MKNLANMTARKAEVRVAAGVGAAFRWRDLLTGPCIQDSVNDDAIRRRESGSDGAITTRGERPFHNRPPNDYIVGVNQEHVVALLVAADGTVGNDQHRFRIAQGNAHPREDSWKQSFVFIFEDRAHGDRSG